ncbi:hypothetical protein QX776_01340 [Alteromonadaceae bacterium BrNp21-10]|nr:hypothetical protein [Alteromonadaceae bacterium BrNp21-10]
MLLFKLILHTAKWSSALGAVVVLSYGFWLPLSINQALIIHPLLLLVLAGIYWFSSDQLQLCALRSTQNKARPDNLLNKVKSLTSDEASSMPRC